MTALMPQKVVVYIDPDGNKRVYDTVYRPDDTASAILRCRKTHRLPVNRVVVMFASDVLPR